MKKEKICLFNNSFCINEKDLNEFIKRDKDTNDIYYFDVDIFNKYNNINNEILEILLISLITSNFETGELDLEVIKEVLDDYDIDMNNYIDILKELNKYIKKIDSNIAFDELKEIFEKGIYTDTFELFKENNYDDDTIFKIVKYNKEKDKNILDFLFNKLNLYLKFNNIEIENFNGTFDYYKKI